MANQTTGRWTPLMIAMLLTLSCALGARADTVIGNWESASSEGWVDWSSAQIPLGAPRFAFNSIGATLGTGAVQFNLPAGGFTQWASLRLQMGSNGVDEWRDDFLANAKLALDVTLVKSEMDPATGNNFAAIGMVVNADGYGFSGMGNPESVTPFSGFNGGNSFNPQLLVGTQTSTWTWDISSVHDGNAATPAAPRVPGDVAVSPSYVEIVFDTYSNGGVVYHIDNVRLITPGDFDDNGVVDGLDLDNKWRPGFGTTGQTNDSNGDGDGDGDVDGNDMLVWQRNLHPAGTSLSVASAVPEPATIGLLVGSLALVAMRRRRAQGRVAAPLA